MFVSSLKLVNFRNFSNYYVSLKNNINILYGPNGSGKTTILEALNLISGLRSFKTRYETDLIKIGEKDSVLSSSFVSGNVTYEIEVILTKGKRQYILNKNNLISLRMYLGALITLAIIPEDSYFFDDAPKNRRKLIDENISKYNKEYLDSLIKQTKLTRQKNELLKNKSTTDVFLYTLNESLSDVEYSIYIIREEFIKEINGYLCKYSSLFLSKYDNLYLRYHSQIKGMLSKQQYLEYLNTNLYKEKEKMGCLFGINYDDLVLYSNNINVKNLLSQGEKKLAVISLKLAVADYLYNKTQEYPILLLDDIVAELDEANTLKLFDIIANYDQVLITTTVLPGYIKEKYFENIIEITKKQIKI